MAKNKSSKLKQKSIKLITVKTDLKNNEAKTENRVEANSHENADIKPIGTKLENSRNAETNNATLNKAIKKNRPNKHKKKVSKTNIIAAEEAGLVKIEQPQNDDSASAAAKLTPTQLAKIEKKKAKKLQKKFKKQLNKAKGPVQKFDDDQPNESIGTVKKKGGQIKELKENVKDEQTVELPKTEERKQKEKEEKKLKQKAKKEKAKSLNKPSGVPEKPHRDPILEAATVFVGNLPTNTKRPQLQRLFQKYGKVVAIRFRTAGGKIVFKHKMRKAAGTLNAYVVLKDPITAKKALALNGVEFKSHHLRVTQASAKSVSAENESNSFDAKRTVFVGNLKYSATEDALREIFSSCGEIDYVRCLRDGEKGCKGVAYVCFKKPDAVGLALELNETLLDERPINVERYSEKKLGAKEKRDAEVSAAKASMKGAKKRLNDKKNKKAKGIALTTFNQNDDEKEKKKKKSEYRGVKVDSLKKKNKMKINNQMMQLAKKIAPKPKSTD